MTQKINLIFMGGFTYPHGMAGTRRIQNLINALKDIPRVKTRVIIQRQSIQDIKVSGVYGGTPYQIVMGTSIRAKMILVFPILYYRTIIALRKAYQPDHMNVIYFYGPLFLNSIIPLIYAKNIGYKIVFDVVEDFEYAKGLSYSLYWKTKVKLINIFSTYMQKLAAGYVVISSHLERKIKNLSQGKASIYFMPISVDIDNFPKRPDINKSIKTFFYAGSFGEKDGITILLDAFDKLAMTHDNIRLVMTGRGARKDMRDYFLRVEKSPYKDRIEYKGYLDQDDYYRLLNDADILCMTRDDIAYAHAGFPFKLGEYLASGNPVIASKVSDVEKYLINQYNAMLVKAGSSEDICRAAQYIMANPDSAKTIGEKGREVAYKYFNCKQQGEELLVFLESL